MRCFLQLKGIFKKKRLILSVWYLAKNQKQLIQLRIIKITIIKHSVAQMSLKDSITSSSKYSLKQSQFLQRLNEPMSTNLIKELSNPTSVLTAKKNKTFKIKKFESLESSSTVEDVIVGQEAKFIACYQNEVIFRKKVDYLIKEHEKRLKQDNPFTPGQSTTQLNSTWRTQKHSEQIQLVQMYQKCKTWITKASETK